MQSSAERFKEGLRKRNLLQTKEKKAVIKKVTPKPIVDPQKQQEAFLNKRIVQLEKENKILFQDKMSVTRKYEILRVSKIKKSNEKNSLDSRYITLSKKYESLRTDKNELRIQNNALQRKNTSLDNKWETLNIVNNQLRIQSKTLISKTKTLKDQNTSLKTTNTSLKLKLRRTRDNIPQSKRLPGAQPGNQHGRTHGLSNDAEYKREYLAKWRDKNSISANYKRTEKYKARPEEEKEIIRAYDRLRHANNRDKRNEQQRKKAAENRQDPLWVHQEFLRNQLRRKKLTDEQRKIYTAERIKVVAEIKRRKYDNKTN